MPLETSWLNIIMKNIKNECNKVRSIQHILSRKNSAAPSSNIKKDASKVKFGSTYTDHMLQIEYNEDCGGWQYPEIVKLQNLSLHPAAKVLHYATTLFEGMKAYRGVDGKIRLFRPYLNLQRLNQSAERACLPKIDSHLLLRFIEKLITVDQDSIPCSDDSLYIRPTLIGIDPVLGVDFVKKALLYVILSPSSAYFVKPISLYANPEFVRAWVGGSGSFKLGANYGPTLFAQKKAKDAGCNQVLWLYGEDEQITEAGVMSIFMYYINDKGGPELLTPPLNSLILPSITRRSILEMTREWNEFDVVEKTVTMPDVLRLNQENRLLEMFAVGTACGITPVSELYYRHKRISIPTCFQNNPLFVRIGNLLNDIQYGRIPHKWCLELINTEELSVEDLYENYKRRATVA